MVGLWGIPKEKLMETARLFIRELQLSDSPGLQRIVRDFEESAYAIYDKPFPKEEEAFLRVVQRFVESQLFFAVFRKGDPEMMGYICFHQDGQQMDLGYCFHSTAQGKGYAREGCQALMEELTKRFQVEGFTAGTALANIPSRKLLENLGFQLLGTEELAFHEDAEGRPLVFQGGIFGWTPKTP